MQGVYTPLRCQGLNLLLYLPPPGPCFSMTPKCSSWHPLASSLYSHPSSQAKLLSQDLAPSSHVKSFLAAAGHTYLLALEQRVQCLAHGVYPTLAALTLGNLPVLQGGFEVSCSPAREKLIERPAVTVHRWGSAGWVLRRNSPVQSSVDITDASSAENLLHC